MGFVCRGVSMPGVVLSWGGFVGGVFVSDGSVSGRFVSGAVVSGAIF